MELAHPLDDGLAQFMIGRHAERRIFARQAIERDAHLLLVGLGLGLHRDLDDRVREFHPLEDDRRIGRAQRVAGGGVLETRQRDDVAGIGDLDVLAVVGMHQQHAADLFLLVLDRVRHLRRGFELARIDAGEGQRADERVVHDLERQRREGRDRPTAHACRWSSPSILRPSTGGMSSGEGRYSMTASSSG